MKKGISWYSAGKRLLIKDTKPMNWSRNRDEEAELLNLLRGQR
jgi:hypothetical protein